MTPQGRLHLAADVRDLQIVDCDGQYCGIVDDIEFEGKAGGELRVASILAGPGAWRGRLSKPVLWIAQRIAGKRMAHIAWSEVEHVTSVVRLARTAKALGLTREEDKAAALLPKIGSVDAIF